MTVNIYDDVNKLEAIFRQTEEFSAVKEALDTVAADEEAMEMFKNFREVQMNMQQKQMQDEEISEEELEHAQKVAQLAQGNEKIMTMLQAEMQLSGLLEEVNKILMKPVQELYETFN